MTFFTNGIQALQHWWKKCVDCKEDYVETKPHLVTFCKSIFVNPWTFQPIIMYVGGVLMV